jgi:formylglycine-generating enzyme required for sulfatase activity
MAGTALENPSFFSNCGYTCPVQSVSWDDIQQFLVRLNQQDPGKGYRLPTEAEWEYAARAGTRGDYGIAGAVCSFAWIVDCSQNRTWPVAQKPANAWGLHDMHGNVREWVQDWYGTYPSTPQTNPTGPATGSVRVLRGGLWSDFAIYARSANRGLYTPSFRSATFGFRLARTP